MPIPLDARKKPSSVKVHVSDGSGLDIAWADGHVSHYDFSYLRDECPCALCDDERRKRQEAPALRALILQQIQRPIPCKCTSLGPAPARQKQ